MSLSVQASFLFSHETVLRSQLHKNNKNLHLKEKEKPKLNLYRNIFYYMFNRPSATDVWGIYSIEMDKKMSQKIGRAGYF